MTFSSSQAKVIETAIAVVTDDPVFLFPDKWMNMKREREREEGRSGQDRKKVFSKEEEKNDDSDD